MLFTIEAFSAFLFGEPACKASSAEPGDKIDNSKTSPHLRLSLQQIFKWGTRPSGRTV